MRLKYNCCNSYYYYYRYHSNYRSLLLKLDKEVLIVIIIFEVPFCWLRSGAVTHRNEGVSHAGTPMPKTVLIHKQNCLCIVQSGYTEPRCYTTYEVMRAVSLCACVQMAYSRPEADYTAAGGQEGMKEEGGILVPKIIVIYPDGFSVWTTGRPLCRCQLICSLTRTTARRCFCSTASHWTLYSTNPGLDPRQPRHHRWRTHR